MVRTVLVVLINVYGGSGGNLMQHILPILAN